MYRTALIPLVCFVIAAGPACKKRETPKPVPKTSSEFDRAQPAICRLIAPEEIETIQQSAVKETKGSTRTENGFRVSQCFYTAAEFSKSVNLALVQKDPKQPNGRSAKDFWNEKFDPYENEQPQKPGGGEREKGPAPKKITGLGDDAYWVSNRFGGTLYVSKGDAFISIGLGGTDDEETKLKKSKALAKKALQRL